ncbi:alpha/beta fold hydrolase [Streptomyces asiaticus]|uniref:alpha/beta fold hydrolase n=1 Tax=Streptomyces asiaticus TaxID=114695 RepID=UPI00380EC224
MIAPADVPEELIDEAARAAREELDSGAVDEVAGPALGAVRVDGRTLSYATLGTAEETVLLVHGYGGDKNSWLFVQEPLSARATVHAIDLPGHGDSTKDVGDGSLDTLAGAVLGFLEQRGIEHVHLVGHSLGGAVVTAAAAREPQLGQDQVLPAANAAALEGRAPVTYVDDAGHMVHMEQPSAVVDAVTGVLDG